MTITRRAFLASIGATAAAAFGAGRWWSRTELPPPYRPDLWTEDQLSDEARRALCAFGRVTIETPLRERGFRLGRFGGGRVREEIRTLLGGIAPALRGRGVPIAGEMHRAGLGAVEELAGFTIGVELPAEEVADAYVAVSGAFAWEPASACTALLARGADGAPLLAAWQDTGLANGRMGARWLTPPGDDATVAQFGNAFLVAPGSTNGMNARGLAVGTAGAGGASGPTPAGAVAAPIHAIVQHLLDACGTTDEAVETLRGRDLRTVGPSGYVLLLLDASGRAARVEISPASLEVRPVEAYPEVAVNEFRLIAGEDAPNEDVRRWNRGRRDLLERLAGAAVDDLGALMGAHHPAGSVCRHAWAAIAPAARREDSDTGWTTQAFAFFPGRRRAAYWPGWPCRAPRIEFPLGEPVDVRAAAIEPFRAWRERLRPGAGTVSVAD